MPPEGPPYQDGENGVRENSDRYAVRGYGAGIKLRQVRKGRTSVKVTHAAVDGSGRREVGNATAMAGC